MAIVNAIIFVKMLYELKDKHEDGSDGHGSAHIQMVNGNALIIGKAELSSKEFEKVKKRLTLLALSHDLCDRKSNFHTMTYEQIGHILTGLSSNDSLNMDNIAKYADEMYKNKYLNIDDIIDKNNYDKTLEMDIAEVMEFHSYSVNLKKHHKMNNVYLEFIRDADLLDGIGASGIVRTIEYGATKGREFFNPDVGLIPYERGGSSTTINHFYEKILDIPNRMYSDKGKQLANERNTIVEDFCNSYLESVGYKLSGSKYELI